jgi:hypothetical protein
MRSELSYDGKGINGPDYHRTRIATFTNAEVSAKYGKLFEAAPELLAACKGLLQAYAPNADKTSKEQGETALQSDVQRARAVIRSIELWDVDVFVVGRPD